MRKLLVSAYSEKDQAKGTLTGWSWADTFSWA